MQPASAIIERFGGVQPLAAALGLSASTVQRWTYSRENGGTDGQIPTKRQHQLLQLARERGIWLSPADFFVTGTLAPETQTSAA